VGRTGPSAWLSGGAGPISHCRPFDKLDSALLVTGRPIGSARQGVGSAPSIAFRPDSAFRTFASALPGWGYDFCTWKRYPPATAFHTACFFGGPRGEAYSQGIAFKMWLPNREHAVIDLRKLREYCLNIEHPRGQHKARVFKRVLGWTASDADQLHQRLLEAARKEDARFLGADDYGQRYALDFHVRESGRETTIRSLWIVRHGRTSRDSRHAMSCKKERCQ